MCYLVFCINIRVFNHHPRIDFSCKWNIIFFSLLVKYPISYCKHVNNRMFMLISHWATEITPFSLFVDYVFTFSVHSIMPRFARINFFEFKFDFYDSFFTPAVKYQIAVVLISACAAAPCITFDCGPKICLKKMYNVHIVHEIYIYTFFNVFPGGKITTIRCGFRPVVIKFQAVDFD